MLLEESGKDAGWVSWDHPLHGYAFPLASDGVSRPDEVQERAIDGIVSFLNRYMNPAG